MKIPAATELTGLIMVSWVDGPTRYFSETAYTSFKEVFDGTDHDDDKSVRVFKFSEKSYEDVTQEACEWLFDWLVERNIDRCPPLLKAYGFEDDLADALEEIAATPSLYDQHSTLNHNQQGLGL